jgi:hypothetical protein
MMLACPSLLSISSDERANVINKPIATILLFKCAASLNPNPGYNHFPATRSPAPRPPPLLHRLINTLLSINVISG